MYVYRSQNTQYKQEVSSPGAHNDLFMLMELGGNCCCCCCSMSDCDFPRIKNEKFGDKSRPPKMKCHSSANSHNYRKRFTLIINFKNGTLNSTLHNPLWHSISFQKRMVTSAPDTCIKNLSASCTHGRRSKEMNGMMLPNPRLHLRNV